MFTVLYYGYRNLSRLKKYSAIIKSKTELSCGERFLQLDSMVK